MMGRTAGIILAVLAHAAFLLFGGLLFMRSSKEEEAKKKVEIVDLLKEDAGEKDKKKQEAEPEPEASETEEAIEAPEEIPDLKELARFQEEAAVPALDAVSLSALEDMLDPTMTSAGAGIFSNSVDLSSGGRIGGAGRAGAADDAVDSVFSIMEIDEKPHAVFQSLPDYPVELRKRKIEGSVYVLFIVDEQGRVVNPRIEKSTQPEFERPALEAVRQWKFEPAVKGGRKVQCKMRVPLRFAIS